MTVVDDDIQERTEFFNADVNYNATAEDASRVIIGMPSQPIIEIRDCEWLKTLV